MSDSEYLNSGARKFERNNGISLHQLIIGLLTAASLLYLGFFGFAKWQANQAHLETVEKRIELEFAIQRHLFELVKAFGSLAFTITAYYAWRNLQVAEQNRKLAEDKLEAEITSAEQNRKLAEVKQVAERFSKAVEMLGSNNLQVRLGGIYSLERISKDSPEDYHWTIMEVLTAFIRGESPKQSEEKTGVPSEVSKSQNPQISLIKIDVQAALTVIARLHNKDFDRLPLDLKNINLHRAQLIDNDGYFRKPRIHLLSLCKADLSGADLHEANFFWLDLFRAYLIGANLSGANLQAANLLEANLSRANLCEATLSDANLQRAELEGANLKGANLYEANLRDTGFEEADLSEANLSSTYLNSAYLHSANLTCTKLCNAAISNANLSGAILNGADLSDAYLDRAYLNGATIDEHTKIDSKWRLVCNILNDPTNNRKLDGIDLCNANLRNANLSDSNLSGANLSGTNLSGVSLNNADLSGASLNNADLVRADLNNTNLNGADIEFANLRQAKHLELKQIQGAQNWENAIYDDGFCKQLGLNPGQSSGGQ
ncbi:MAG: pentapeptide repeat-containing protein [Cyanobacteria bacterium P01_A01_bin.123]